ncbi:MAG: FkbM family methyltransferase, partial [Candidatus Paceibacterota bacterium]
TTLDHFVYNNQIDNLSIIKIDVEGHEANVLKGGIKTFKNTSPIVLIEIHTIKAMYDSDNFMKNLGYHSDVIHQEKDGRLFLKYYKN